MEILAVRVPAGDYYVGDPCYGVPGDRWMEWLVAADFANVGRGILAAELDGKLIVGVSTRYGDGRYDGSDGEEYPVDAGLIGVVPVELVEGEPCGMVKRTFVGSFVCEYDEGVIRIGDIEIDTN